MGNLPVSKRTPRQEASHQQQLSIAFEVNELRGLPPSERAKVIFHLATLLLQAVGIETEGSDDGQP